MIQNRSKISSIELERLFCDIVDRTMGELWSRNRGWVHGWGTRVTIGSVVQALRCNSSSTLPVVRYGSECFFLIQSDFFPVDDDDDDDDDNDDDDDDDDDDNDDVGNGPSRLLLQDEA